MIISLIVAATTNDVIGRDGTMPWHLPDDLAYFKRKTLGHCVVMGRKTFESFGGGKALPKRRNIVLSRQKKLGLPEGVDLVTTIEEALLRALDDGMGECFVIGGAEVYALALPFAHRIYMTRISAVLSGDTYFPLTDWTAWNLVRSEMHPPDERHDYGFCFEYWERCDNAVPARTLLLDE